MSDSINLDHLAGRLANSIHIASPSVAAADRDIVKTGALLSIAISLSELAAKPPVTVLVGNDVAESFTPGDLEDDEAIDGGPERDPNEEPDPSVNLGPLDIGDIVIHKNAEEWAAYGIITALGESEGAAYAMIRIGAPDGPSATTTKVWLDELERIPPAEVETLDGAPVEVDADGIPILRDIDDDFVDPNPSANPHQLSIGDVVVHKGSEERAAYGVVASLGEHGGEPYARIRAGAADDPNATTATFWLDELERIPPTDAPSAPAPDAFAALKAKKKGKGK